MTNKTKAKKILELLEQKYPDATCGLDFETDPYKLLVMAILSAQTTDKVVNKVSETLFLKYPDPLSMANSKPGELEEEIRTIGLYNTKARNLRKTTKRLVEVYNGVVPSDMEELLTLPGVGRKVANLIRGDLYSLGGIVADTHCIRVSNRLGFVDSPNPLIVERTMDKLIPVDRQSGFCHRVVVFGREYCIARRPRCEDCFVKELCKYYNTPDTDK